MYYRKKRVYRRKRRAFVKRRKTFARRRRYRRTRRGASDLRRPYARDHQLLKITIENSDIPSQSGASSIYLPLTNHLQVSCTTNELNDQVQNALADRWEQYTIVKAVTRFRLLGVKGNSYYVPAEQYSGSHISPDHQQYPTSTADLSEILQLPYGRKHPMYGGSRTWYPKLVSYAPAVGFPTDTQVKYTMSKYVATSSSGDTGNIKWGGLGLILPGVHTTPTTYASSDLR